MKAATTKIIDNYGDEITIYKTPYGGTYDGIKCPLWIHDEGDMVTYYLQNNGEYIDTTDNYHCDLEGVPYALVLNANGEVASVELVPSTGYVVDGESFDSLRDALEAARNTNAVNTVTLYRISTIYADPYRPDFWSTYEWDNCELETTETATFILPKGFEVAICVSGLPEIYDEHGFHCELSDAYNGEPLLDGCIVLKRA
jgi:hypothetical protein